MLLALIKTLNRSMRKLVIQTSLHAKLNAIRSMIAQLSSGMVATVSKEKMPMLAIVFLQLQNGIKIIKQLKATQVRDIRTQNALLDQKIVMAMSLNLTQWRDSLLRRK